MMFSISIETSSSEPLSLFSKDRAWAIYGTTAPSIEADDKDGVIGRSANVGDHSRGIDSEATMLI